LHHFYFDFTQKLDSYIHEDFSLDLYKMVYILRTVEKRN
jgi:hypothetical protein